MKLVEDLKWRYATKKMDSSKKVSKEHITLIKEAVQLSPASYGLQSYKVLEITDQKLREELDAIANPSVANFKANQFLQDWFNTKLYQRIHDDRIV